ncbi:CHAT domain-containing protein [candidate division KSB1 bacterium]|nr:CHAT domain-containing protein [candidate division KSB1 bacterium]
MAFFYFIAIFATNLQSFAQGWQQEKDVTAFQQVILAYETSGKEAFAAKNYRKAEKNFIDAIKIAKQYQITTNYGHLLFQLGEVYFEQADFTKASTIFQLAADTLKNDSLSIRSLMKLGEIYFSTNNFEYSRYYYSAAFKKSLEIEEIELQPQLASHIAESYMNLGDYSRAMGFLQRGLELSQKNSNQIETGKIFNRLGIFHYALGENVVALEYFNQASVIFNNANVPELQGQIFLNYGNLYLTVKDSAKAWENFSNAYRLYEKSHDHINLIKTMNSIGEFFIEYQNYGDAILFFSRALMFQEQAHLNQFAFRIYLNLGIIHFNLNYPELALDYFSRAEQSIQNYKDKNLFWKIHFYRAKILENRKKYQEAKAEYEKGSTQIKEYINKLQTKNQQNVFQQNVQVFYENYILLFLEHPDIFSGNTNQAFQILEELKTIALNDEPGALSNHTPIDSTRRDSLRLERIRCEQEISQIIKQLDQLLREKKEKADSLRTRLLVKRSELEKKKFGIDLILKQYSMAQNTAKQANSVKNDSILALQDIQKKLFLKPMLIIEYFLSEPNSYVWVIKEDYFGIYALAARSEIKNYIEILQNSRYATDKHLAEMIEKPIEKLSEILITPIKKHLERGKKIIIVPDAELSNLPFELLKISPSNAKTDEIYLIEHNKIIYSPSSTQYFLRNNKKYTAGSRDILLLGDPVFERQRERAASSALSNTSFMFSIHQPKRLLYTSDEIDSIKMIFQRRGKRIDILRGEQATESNLLNLLNSRDYEHLHFATHGLIYPHYPELSGLFLSVTDSTSDGFLRIPEIEHLKYKPKLVVLSACQTGGGPLFRFSGVENLARAFIKIGTQGVIVSLWNVDDRSTAYFMNHFYSGLINEGLTASEALATAKIEMLKDKTYQHPFYWAPFILIGTEEY